MVVLSAKPSPNQFSPTKNQKPNSFSGIPAIDLSNPDCKTHLVKACEEVGFFKVVNHGIPMDLITGLENEAVKFFSLPMSEKEKAGPAEPLGYGNKRIGPNGDVGWVEYLLLETDPKSLFQRSMSISRENPKKLCSAVGEYVSSVRKLVYEVLGLLAEGLKIEPRNVFSKLLIDGETDSVLRLNHYPPCPLVQNLNCNMIGFGEHTDPQLLSISRSNSISGLQISIRDGTWVSVPPDQNAFFINVGDCLQVLTNGRFKSVKHRVLANCLKSRVSMIYFGGPPLTAKVAPLTSVMTEGEKSLYKEFTWYDFKKAAYLTRLAENRLSHFTIKAKNEDLIG